MVDNISYKRVPLINLNLLENLNFTLDSEVQVIEVEISVVKHLIIKVVTLVDIGIPYILDKIPYSPANIVHSKVGLWVIFHLLLVENLVNEGKDQNFDNFVSVELKLNNRKHMIILMKNINKTAYNF